MVKHHKILVNHTKFLRKNTEARMDLYNVDQVGLLH